MNNQPSIPLPSALDALSNCTNPSECAEAAAEVYAYLDGELTEQKRDQIAAHLEDCPGCFDAFEFHTELRALISKGCQCPPPEGLKDRIQAALAQVIESERDGSAGSA